MHRLLMALAMAFASTAALAADDAALCAAGKGTYLTGEVVAKPKFAHGRFRKGYELSHTHLKVRDDRSGQVYDVAIDNVFASGYDRNNARIPSPVDQIRAHDKVEVCGAPYTSGGLGIHWVHPNCRGTPDPQHPDGFIKRIEPNGQPSDNLESSTSLCRLF